MHAIETIYKGYLFRSRIEARWASFFDNLSWKWVYEPTELHGYIPDFIMQFYRPLIIEVKGDAFSKQDLLQHIEKIDKSGWEHEALIVGTTPFPSGCDEPYGPTTNPPIGILKDDRGWEEAHFFRCRECHEISFYHAYGAYTCRVCGGYDGAHHVGAIYRDEIEALWARAQNSTRWLPGDNE